ncbi:MAG: pyridoxamine 5'-phosphate oxidase family protein [Nitrososphaerales archaeon]
MPSKQGDLNLLKEPVAQELLKSTNPARLAYIWRDGTPRVIPIWFHWNGKEVVVGSPLKAPKMQVLSQNPKVALTIDSNTWPYKVLMIRGTAQVETMDGVLPEYTLMAKRYLGEEQGRAFVDQNGQWFSQTVRISVRPEWVGILDFEKRFPSAIEAAISG